MSEPCGDSVPCVRVVIDFDDDYSPPSPIPQLPFSLPTSPLMPDDGEETVEESPAGSRDGESECIVSPREERLRRREAFTAQARHLDPQKDPCNAGVASGSEAFRGGAQSSCGGGDCAESGDQAIYNSSSVSDSCGRAMRQQQVISLARAAIGIVTKPKRLCTRSPPMGRRYGLTVGAERA